MLDLAASVNAGNLGNIFPPLTSRPEVTSERWVILRFVGAVVVRIGVDEVLDLLNVLWSDTDGFL
ncbi:hypothetical protein [Amycolatopsis sp. cmx-4-61]|uniref:hypothetical protein n=1 Tax=Amycolatopsis sp. cmx-4-61 TaxID=2790937 RepID=UPI003978F789